MIISHVIYTVLLGLIIFLFHLLFQILGIVCSGLSDFVDFRRYFVYFAKIRDLSVFVLVIFGYFRNDHIKSVILCNVVNLPVFINYSANNNKDPPFTQIPEINVQYSDLEISFQLNIHIL